MKATAKSAAAKAAAGASGTTSKKRKRVKRLLSLGGRTTRSLERTIGVDHCHIARIARGERRPSLEVAGKLAAALGITLDDLYRQLG